MPNTPQHCPGFTNFKNLKSFMCKCPECGKEKEIFSDEFDRPQTCSGCGKPIDFEQCRLSGEAKSTEPA
jgi:rubredoxin